MERIVCFPMFKSESFATCISPEDKDKGLDQLYGTLIDDQY